MKNKFNIKPLTMCIALGLFSHAAAESSPFADIPLHLIDHTVTTVSSSLKPNVLVQIDTGTLMRCGVGDVGNQCVSVYPKRIDVTRSALLDLIRNPQYRDAFHWGFLTTLNEGSPAFSTKTWAENVARGGEFGIDPSKLENAFEKLSFGNPASPHTARYLDALYLLEKSMKYRCQRSYAVVFLAGYVGDTTYVTLDDRSKAKYASSYIPPAWDRLFFNNTTPITVWGSSQNWVAKNGFYEGQQKRKDGSYPFTYEHPNPNRFKVNIGDLKGMGLFKSDNVSGQPGKFFFNNMYWGNHPDALRYFAETVYARDLKPEGQDAGGGNWNDPKFSKGKQNIITYGIGMGVGKENEAVFSIDGLAVGTGDTSDLNNIKGKALIATDQASLTKAFETIFDKIKENESQNNTPPESFSAVSPAVSPDEIESSANVGNLVIASYLDIAGGATELRFYPLAANATSTTKDQYKQADFSQRKVLINSGNSVSWFDGTFSGNNDFFGIPANETKTNQDEWKNALMPWLLRSKTDSSIAQEAQNKNYALRYRERVTSPDRRNMGDVTGSPLILSKSPYAGHSGYHPRFLITAANDGMVYLFSQQNNTTHPYKMLLNYIPAGMERESVTDTLAKHLKNPANPDYVTNPNTPHQYLINGGINVRITDSKTAPYQQMFLVGNMGQGGRGAYALNLGGRHRTTGNKIGLDTDSGTWQTSVPMFETPKGADNQLGYTVGTPQLGRLSFDRSMPLDASGKPTRMITSVSDLTQAVFIGSGFASPNAGSNIEVRKQNSESALYIYSALSGINLGTNSQKNNTQSTNSNTFADGTLIKKLVAPGNGGLAQPTLVDANFDGAVDFVYAGDYGGSLYRFDLRAGDESMWTVKKIFQTSNNQPITSAPAVYRNDENNYIVMFGTGTDMFIGDHDVTDQQAFYGVYDDLSQLDPIVKTPKDLLQQTLSQAKYNGRNVRNITNLELDETHRGNGWYFNLSETGERVVIKPDVVLKTVYFTTRHYQPTIVPEEESGDKCVVTKGSRINGNSWHMQVRVDNGGQIPTRGKGSSLYSYLDYFNENIQKDFSYRPEHIYAGIASNNGIFNTIFQISGGNVDMIGGLGNSTTFEGDTGNSGQDFDPKDGGHTPKRCLSRKEQKVYISGTQKDSSIDVLSLYGQICSVFLRRLSWREIF